MPQNPQYSWIDPTLIQADDQIIIVLVDDRVGLVGWFIKWWSAGEVKDHVSGAYNHVMIMRKNGMVVSQNGYLEEIPISRYMKPSIFLKFWRLKNLTAEELALINSAIDKRLALPRWKRGYDFLGLVGQSFPFLHWMQVPGWFFCSEAVSFFVRQAKRFSWLPKEANPTDFDVLNKVHPEDVEVIGYYWQD